MSWLKKSVHIFLAVLILAVPAFTCNTLQVNAETVTDGHSVVYDNSSNDDYDVYKSKYGFEKAGEEVAITYANHVSGAEIIDDEEYSYVCKLQNRTNVTFAFSVPKNGAYNVEIFFSPLDDITQKYDFSLKIDGEFPFSKCERLRLFSLWEDDGEIRTLTNGDEVNPLQKHKPGYSRQKLFDSSGIETAPYEFMLSAGDHTLTLRNAGKDFAVSKIVLIPPENVNQYREVYETYKSIEKYSGDQIVIEAERPEYKNTYSLSSKSDQGTANISPSNATRSVINYIGGTTWNNVGSEITWKFNAPDDGLYKLGIAFKQSYVADGEVYRTLKIDGKIPFAEAAEINFPYGLKWQFKEFCDNSDNDYLFHLTKGEHTLSLSVTLADISEVFRRLDEIVEPLGDLYLDMVMITGENPDNNRDYELQNQIPGFEETLNKAYRNITSLSNDIKSRLRVNSELNGALNNMSHIIKEMTDNLYDAHLQIKRFSSAQQTLSAWLYDIKNMSLAVDQIIIAAPDKNFDTPQASFFERIKFSLMRYVNSYVSTTHSNISGEDKSLPTIKIWVNWGRDQVKVLNSLIQDSFTPENDVNVLVEQVNATLVQGVISGNSPDLYLHMARTEPVNLAMRGVLYNLEKYPDFNEVVAENYDDGAITPYIYQNGTYALPDMQNFYVLFYRKDIFDKLNLKVPKTWDDFLAVTGVLQRNKMNSYLPYTKLGAAGTVNIGAGGLTIFPTMLLQRGAQMYNDAQNGTNLASDESVTAFKFWTEFYTDYSLDQDANFYQKFRVGTIPMGITSYTQYLTIRVGAPEISGKWGISEIPGIVDNEGNIVNVCSGAGTGVSVMKSSKEKDAAWKFVKWWISADTQFRYSAEVEAIIGETGRVASANKEAVSRLSWDEESLKVIINQWDKVNEIPEIPGSYYVSRSIDQAFWATKNGKKSAKEAIMDWSIVSDNEIKRKIAEYADKNYGG